MSFDFTRAADVLSGERPIAVGGELLAIPRPVRRPDGAGGWRCLRPNHPDTITSEDVASLEWEEVPPIVDGHVIRFDCEESP